MLGFKVLPAAFCEPTVNTASVRTIQESRKETEKFIQSALNPVLEEIENRENIFVSESGFDNKIEMLEDTVSELEGGEVGSGHIFTAVYEIDPRAYYSDSTLSKNNDINIVFRCVI